MTRPSRLIFIGFFMFAAVAFAQERGLQPKDYYNEIDIEEVAMSPDGSLIAFTKMSINEKENNRHREIWLVEIKEGMVPGEPFLFTSQVHDSRSPRWSPDGKLLAFSSQRGDDKNSVWFARVTAPGGEAFHIDGVDGMPVWSPDGKWIAYTKTPEDEDNDKKNNREGWIAPDAITNTLDAERFDGHVITEMQYKRDGVIGLLPHSSVRKKTQLFVAPAEGGEARQLTDLPFNVRGVKWTVDSNAITFYGDPKEDDEYFQDSANNIYRISLDGGEPVALTGENGSEFAQDLSPDGSKIVYLYYKSSRGEPTDLIMDTVSEDGSLAGQPLNLTEKWDLSPGVPKWTTDSKYVYYTAGDHGSWHVFFIDVETLDFYRITGGECTVRVVSIENTNSFMAYTINDPLHPTELYISTTDGTDEKQITNFNDSWINEIELEYPEPITWQVADGTDIEGWLLKPVGYDPTKKYPMILKIHGGPHSHYGNYWFRTFHILSASGFFVLYSNPRGSGTYGHDFQYATRGKWGEMDTEDLFTGLDIVLSKYPQIDATRIGVSGGSYGGYMTNWLTATSDRFAAAVTSRSIADWESWYGTSDAQGLTEHEFYGPPWEQRELYRRLSPISYVENVTAPTLIIHSEEDTRTPISDGEMWYMALKKRQVPVEMARYPRSFHGLSRNGEPWLLVDRLERLRTWFVHWLIDVPEGKTGEMEGEQ